MVKTFSLSTFSKDICAEQWKSIQILQISTICKMSIFLQTIGPENGIANGLADRQPEKSPSPPSIRYLHINSPGIRACCCFIREAISWTVRRTNHARRKPWSRRHSGRKGSLQSFDDGKKPFRKGCCWHVWHVFLPWCVLMGTTCFPQNTSELTTIDLWEYCDALNTLYNF